MNEEVDPDQAVRYRAAIWAGIFYLIAGIFATTLVDIFLFLPGGITDILAGLTLLGTLQMCLQTTFEKDKFRESALLTFLLTMSGVTLLGIGSTLWWLLAGLIHIQLTKNTLKMKIKTKKAKEIKS
jgi:benzoate membrane transport protein